MGYWDFCKPVGCPHYKKTRFLVAPEATDILIGFRDQVRLGILPQSYPCYLREQQEECRYSEEIYAPDHPEDEADEENYDPHVHLARRIVNNILAEKSEDIIPKNYRERSRM